MPMKLDFLGEVEASPEVIAHANGLMEEVAKRALRFAPRYTALAVDIPNDDRGVVAWNLLNIMNMYRGTPLLLKGWRQPKFVNPKHYAVERVWNPFRWRKLLQEPAVLELNFKKVEGEPTLREGYAEPLAGISDFEIALIARVLYGWNKSEKEEVS